MATQKTETQTETRTDRTGVVPGVAHLAIDLVDRGQSTVINLLQDARGELRTVLEHGIELAEKSSTSLFRFARKATQRIDDGLAETLTNAERLIGGAVKSARETTRMASQLAGTAATGITGAAA